LGSDILTGNMPDVTPPRLDLLDFGGVDIQSQNPAAGFRKLQPEGQADIAQPDHGNIKLQWFGNDLPTLPPLVDRPIFRAKPIRLVLA
jgi:hypothetical protein